MITQEQQDKITELLKTCYLPVGVGTGPERACSIAAINLALTGKMTDDIPDCMSIIIGKWIIEIQDSMPHDMRNSDRWKSLLPMAAGTGRDKEKERIDIILDWMWNTVLSKIQPIAEKYGFGDTWLNMISQATPDAARSVAAATRFAAASSVAYSANCAATSAADAADAARSAADADYAARAAARAAVYADRAADYAARAADADYAARAAAYAKFWKTIDPCSLLEKLCK